MPVGAWLRVPISSQDGVRIGALPPGTAPVVPQDGACLLLLELLPVFPWDLHRVVLGHGGLRVPRPLEESHLQGPQARHEEAVGLRALEQMPSTAQRLASTISGQKVPIAAERSCVRQHLVWCAAPTGATVNAGPPGPHSQQEKDQEGPKVRGQGHLPWLLKEGVEDGTAGP